MSKHIGPAKAALTPPAGKAAAVPRGPGHHRARRLPAAVAMAVLALLGTGCAAHPAPAASMTPASASASAAAAARLPAFYTAPGRLPPESHGTLIRAQRVSAPGLDGTAYRVMYLSQTVSGVPDPVTGLVIVPGRRPPAGGYPVITWGHGSDGLAEQCAPSLDPVSDVPLANQLLAQGWEITASDGQGYAAGTPGPAPYLVGTSAARNVIDIVRAARQLPAAHASSRYVVWGHSEGGQTALFTMQAAAGYAPDLRLEGVVAGAPPSQFSAMYQVLAAGPYHHYLFMVAGGYNTAYGSQAAPLGQVLTPFGLSKLPVLSQDCDVASAIDTYPAARLFKADPFTVPAWQRLLAANDPGTFTAPSRVPLLIIQGGDDTEVPVISTQLLAAHLCGIGQVLQRWIYPGQTHTSVFTPSAPDMIGWIAARFSGDPFPSRYAPHGQPGIQVTRCPGSTGPATR
jgi:alpha-beta hydrolase superfamily lysophospholipase